MKHELKSGLLVESNEYYQLLDWKDKNPEKCQFYLKEFGLTSINDIHSDLTFNGLLQFAGIC